MFTASIPLIQIKKRQFYENATWITINKLYDSPLRETTNEQMDKFFTDYGKPIVDTHGETNEFGFRTGREKKSESTWKKI